MSGIVIIGAGHGGVQMAASLRDEGYDGPIRVVSSDPDLPYHKPPLSKSFMKDADAPLQPLRGAVFYAQNDITLDLGHTVVSIDPAAKVLICDDCADISYDRLVMATGTRARRLPFPGQELGGVHVLRTATDARAMRLDLPNAKRAVVIGGGFIGLEAAAMMAARGIDVSVVEMAPQLLGRAASTTVAQAIAHQLITMGVDLYLAQSVTRIEAAQDHVIGVRLPEQVLPADLVLVGIGAEPVVELAKGAGVKIDNGVAVDGFLATSVPDIYAIGDCVSFPMAGSGDRMRLESVQNATDQARALAKTLTGTPTGYDALPWFWSDIGPQKLQIAGLLPQGGDSIVTHTEDGQLKSVYHLKDGQLRAVETLNSGGEHMLARRMIAEGITPDPDVLASGDMKAIKAAYMALKAG